MGWGVVPVRVDRTRERDCEACPAASGPLAHTSQCSEGLRALMASRAHAEPAALPFIHRAVGYLRPNSTHRAQSQAPGGAVGSSRGRPEPSGATCGSLRRPFGLFGAEPLPALKSRPRRACDSRGTRGLRALWRGRSACGPRARMMRSTGLDRQLGTAISSINQMPRYFHCTRPASKPSIRTH